MIFDPNLTYSAIDAEGHVIKHNMKFLAMIPAEHSLTEDECTRYYGSGLDHVKLKTSRNNRFVFDKMVISLPHEYIKIVYDEVK